MASGWRYRAVSILGAATLVAGSLAVANLPEAQIALDLFPLLGRLPGSSLRKSKFSLAGLTAVGVILFTLYPLFKPRPRRILDTITLTEKRLFLAVVTLAAIGYFDYSYQLPRSTLIILTAMLGAVLPVFFVSIRRRPQTSTRAIIVGDDPEKFATLREAASIPLEGYVAPPAIEFGTTADDVARGIPVSDGGVHVADGIGGLERLGGLSRLEDVLIENDIDTVLLAFAETDRAEFFGTLETCYEHGVTVKINRQQTSSVLVANVEAGELVEVDLEPLDWQEHATKRLFDVTFAGVALVVLSPLTLLIAVAIRLDSDGSVLYSQERTAEFGETFKIYKFRTMLPESEDTNPVDDAENTRITRVGRALRKTHLDEIPQLWTILTGKMSVVGPRAVWTDEETHLEDETVAWRKRWFVKPGLTGLAQINEVTSTDPKTKLQYDLTYIRQQSFWFDLKIVIRQIWQVGGHFVAALRSFVGR
jgi:lipopolysaccharide/colanic/teichoic acid biosynthesis glycosyltransferase